MAFYRSSNIKIDNATIKYDANGQLVARGGGGGGDASIDDNNISTTTTYSSAKTESRLAELKEEIDEEYGGTVLSYNDTLAVLGVPPSPFYQYRICTPIMTANNAPSPYVCSASTETTNFEAYKAFRRINDGEGWISLQGDVENSWIQFKFGEPKVIGRVTIKNLNTPSPLACKQFKLLASNTGTDGDFASHELGVCNVSSDTMGATQSFDVENGTSYLYYRLLVKQGYNASKVAFGQIDLMEKYMA